MPNWTSNVLVVKGTKERLQEFDKAFKGRGAYWKPQEYELRNKTEEEQEQYKREHRAKYEASEPDYSFDALYPVPQDVIDVGYSGERPEDVSIVDSIMDRHSWYDGYTWCVSHWGTKWDIADTRATLGEEEYVYEFDTAWSPPVDWVQHVAEVWDDLHFLLKYEEGGMQFAGYMEWLEGYSIDQDHVDGDGYRDFVIENMDYDPYEGFEDDFDYNDFDE